MKSILSYAVLLIQFIGKAVEIGMGRHGLMESRIKDGNLRNARQDFFTSFHPF